jgi:hypothetical protein
VKSPGAGGRAPVAERSRTPTGSLTSNATLELHSVSRDDLDRQGLVQARSPEPCERERGGGGTLLADSSRAMRSPLHLALAAVAVLFSGCLFNIGKGDLADGAVCHSSDECHSGQCLYNLCDGSSCSCSDGPCPDQGAASSDCDEGWLCAHFEPGDIWAVFGADDYEQCVHPCAVSCPEHHSCYDGAWFCSPDPSWSRPIVTAMANPAEVAPGDEVTLLATAVSPIGDTDFVYTWLFTDTYESVTGPTTTRAFPKSGHFRIDLDVESGGGAREASASVTVTVCGLLSDECGIDSSLHHGPPCCGDLVCKVDGGSARCKEPSDQPVTVPSVAVPLASVHDPVARLIVKSPWVFWATDEEAFSDNGNNIQRVSVDGGEPQLLFNGEFNTQLTAVTKDFIFWDPGNSDIMRAAHDGSGATKVTFTAPQALSLSDDMWEAPSGDALIGRSHYNGASAIMQLSVAGGEVSHLTPVEAIFELIVHGEHVYYVTAAASDGPFDVSHLVLGGTPEKLFTRPTYPEDFQADADSLYWEEEGWLYRAPLAGGEPIKLYESWYSQPYCTHGDWIYYVDGSFKDEEVFRMRKAPSKPAEEVPALAVDAKGAGPNGEQVHPSVIVCDDSGLFMAGRAGDSGSYTILKAAYPKN